MYEKLRQMAVKVSDRINQGIITAFNNLKNTNVKICNQKHIQNGTEILKLKDPIYQEMQQLPPNLLTHFNKLVLNDGKIQFEKDVIVPLMILLAQQIQLEFRN